MQHSKIRSAARLCAAFAASPLIAIAQSASTPSAPPASASQAADAAKLFSLNLVATGGAGLFYCFAVN